MCNPREVNLTAYKSSYMNGFGISLDESSGSLAYATESALKEEFINKFISDNQQQLSKPQVRKTMSWSITNPTVHKERDFYLMPYACNDIRKFTGSFGSRKRSATLPLRYNSTPFLSTLSRTINCCSDFENGSPIIDESKDECKDSDDLQSSYEDHNFSRIDKS